PENLPLNSAAPRPTPHNRERMITYLLRQGCDRPGPLTLWLVKRENAYFAVSGHSKPATKGRMKTSHFEGSIAYWAARAALDRNERTQRELAAFDCDFGGQRLVQPADCA